MGRPEGERRHLWLKRFLDKELARPFCIIPGDNWPWGFDKVFGSFHYSFDFGGYHFLFSAVDRQAKKDGCAVFDEATWRWMDEDLKANSDKPTLFIMHETMWPPTFLEAGKTEALLNATPQCLAALCGHLHLDLDLTHGSLRQLVAPAIGRSHRPAFKLLRFYKEAIVIDSYEWDAGSQAFCQAQKWQKIDVPEGLQARLIPGKCAFENKSNRPATPRELDNALKERAGELNNSLFGFILSFGLKQIFGK